MSRVEPVELPGEDAEDEDELDDGRDELQDEEPRQFLDAVAAPFEDARQAARLALEVEAQREPMHVLEGLHRELAHRVHGDLGEEAVANLAQERHGDARQPVECREQERRPPQPGTRRHCRFAPLPCLDRRCDGDERVGRPLERVGRQHRHELRDDEKPERHEDAALQIGPAVRPQIGAKLYKRRDEAGPLRRSRACRGRGGNQ